MTLRNEPFPVIPPAPKLDSARQTGTPPRPGRFDRDQVISEQLMSVAMQLHGTLSLITDEPVAVHVRTALDHLDRSVQALRQSVADRQWPEPAAE